MRILLALLLLLTCSFVSALAGDNARQFHGNLAMPVAEAAYKTAGWMSTNGLIVRRQETREKVIIISGSRDGEDGEWRVELSPHSPLGTRVSIRVSGSGEEFGLDELTSLLQSQDGEDGGLLAVENPSIPQPILNQIGNVACIHVQAAGRVLQFSGFFIDSEGLIVCTAHDLREHEQVKVMTNTGVLYEGNIIKADFSRDLALIVVEADKEEIVDVSEGRNLLGVGETVYSIGCPINLRGTIQTGHINGPPRMVEDTALWQMSMNVQPGSSGSPVFDASGMFLGVVKGRHREADDIGFIIPVEVVVDFLRDYFSS